MVGDGRVDKERLVGAKKYILLPRQKKEGEFLAGEKSSSSCHIGGIFSQGARTANTTSSYGLSRAKKSRFQTLPLEMKGFSCYFYPVAAGCGCGLGPRPLLSVAWGDCETGANADVFSPPLSLLEIVHWRATTRSPSPSPFHICPVRPLGGEGGRTRGNAAVSDTPFTLEGKSPCSKARFSRTEAFLRSISLILRLYAVKTVVESLRIPHPLGEGRSLPPRSSATVTARPPMVFRALSAERHTHIKRESRGRAAGVGRSPRLSLSSPLIPSGIIAAGVMLMDDPSPLRHQGQERKMENPFLPRERTREGGAGRGGELRRLLKGFDSAE